MRTTRWIGCTLALALPLVAACKPAEETTEPEQTAMEETAPAPEEPMEAATPRTAAADLVGTDGSTRGMVTFTEEGDGSVHVVAKLEGFEPGEHGFHIHETGDCSAADFTSAGGHFNPAGTDHACPPTTPRHAGDFGNATIAEDGTGNLDAMSDLVTLGEGDTSIVGRAVVVHAGADDCTSQPSGAAGARMACGVIEPAAANMQDETDAMAEPMAGEEDTAGDDGY